MRIKEINIPNFDYPDLYRIGIVKVQMPEQLACDDTFRIKIEEKERNCRIVENVLNQFGQPIFSSGRTPNFFMFPEFSICEEAAELIESKFHTTNIRPNTVAFFGMERLSKERFFELLHSTDRNEDFLESQFGLTIRFVNTAVIIIKDKDSNTKVYYQPKCSKSGDERSEQFESDLMYLFEFGNRRCILSTCSDLFVGEHGIEKYKHILGCVSAFFKNEKRMNPLDIKIDLWFHLQKNRNPMGDLYTNFIKTLFFRHGHEINTTKTIVFSVNSALENREKKYRHSNVAVMDRGRKPNDLAERNSEISYAWKAFKGQGIDKNTSIHYVLWRLKSGGIISFVLNTDDRPYQVTSPQTPIVETRLYEIIGTDFVELHEHPEVYELKELLLEKFGDFISHEFSSPEWKAVLTDQYINETMLDSLFCNRPIELLKRLMILHDCTKRILNCDLWLENDNDDPFEHFLLSLRLLSERYDQLILENNRFKHQSIFIDVLDCDNKTYEKLLEKQSEISTHFAGADIVLLQRIQDSINWDGAPTDLGKFFDSPKVSRVCRTNGTQPNPSISRVGYPSALSLSYLIKSLRSCNEFGQNPSLKLKEILHECF